MSELIREDRNGCALHGAIKTLSAVEGLVPVLHASPGCSLGARYGEAAKSGSLSGAAGWLETSATNLQEKHVVFGGTSRLREQLKNTVKVLSGELYVVATGCVPEVVGDDVPAMVKESREQRYPVVGISTPGFKGNGWHGHALTVRQILEQLPLLDDRAPERDPGLVNILGIAPGLDSWWEGDLESIGSSLEHLGLRANLFFGIGNRPSGWKAALDAALTVVLSPWGVEAARFLDEKYGVPVLDFGFVPVGSRDTAALLEGIAGALGLPPERVQSVNQAENGRLRHFLRKAAPRLLEEGFQKRTAVVAGTSAAVGISRFVAGTLGQILTTVVVVDDPPAESRAEIAAKIRELEGAANAEVLFASSGSDIRRALLDARPELLLGSSLERDWARAHGSSLVEISSPVTDRIALDRPLSGVGGGLHLLSEILRASPSTGRSAHAREDVPLEYAANGASRTVEAT